MSDDLTVTIKKLVEETDYGTFTYYPGVLSGTSQWWGDMVFAASEEIVLKRDADQAKDDSTLIRQIRLEEVPSLLSSGVIGGGMIPKIQCCVNALEHGVHRTHILDGRIPHSILTEMLSHQGIGTMLWE